jgi:predicted HNH restriction endonuclease
MPKVPAVLDYDGLRLLQLLVSRLARIRPNDPRTFISYKEVHDALGLQQEGPTFGESLKHQGLNSLAEWSATTAKPGITGLIIDKSTLRPGEGYFKLFGKTSEDFDWWRTEIEKARSFRWEPYLSGEPLASELKDEPQWSSEELRAAVVTYLEMQRFDRAGVPFTKKRYYEALSEKFGRSAKSFEYRMQNISYVMALMGRDWLSGMKPAGHVGANVATQIEQLIAEEEGLQLIPVVAFEMAVRENMKKKGLTLPKGNQSPDVITTEASQFKRDASVKAWVLNKANGICECCGRSAPFKGTDGLPYLEVHHVQKLAEKGTDMTSNAVAVCPNCHRELHYGGQAKQLVEQLYQSIERLRRG